MPLHLNSISRREFIRNSIIAGAGLAVFRHASAAPQGDGSRWALFSDTHIDANPDIVAREVNMAAHLKQAIAEALALDEKPAGVLINGDCAYLRGLPEDYATFSSLIAPLSGAKLPVHMTLGNHDDRDNFRKALAAACDPGSPVASRHVSIVETPPANWVLLDSLEKVNSTPGLLGEEQRNWLVAALDARKDKPAIVMMHHNPQVVPPGDTEMKISGLRDTAELLEILLPRKHVKALVFGHSHTWSLKQQDGLHLVNLPAVAYVFSKTQPSGWVNCRLAEGGATLELRSLDTAHPEHGKKTELKWRT